MLRVGVLLPVLIGLIPIAAEAAAPATGLAPGARNRVTGELCEPAQAMEAAKRESPPAKKLGELPPGNTVLTVVREVDGCAVPVVVRYGVGGNRGKTAPEMKRR